MTEQAAVPQQNDEVETSNEVTTSEPKQVILEVKNPTPEEMKELCANIKGNSKNVNVKETTFNFKKSTDKETGIETIRKPVNLAIPYPSVQGIISILEAEGKQLELLMEAVESVVNSQARDLLYEDEKLTAADFPVDKLTWDYIANLPKAQRRGGGIPKETWEAFIKDYIAVMPEVTGKTIDQITNASKILMSKLNQVKTNEPVLNFMVEQLSIYVENSPNAEEYSECLEFLMNKAETYLNTSEEELLANL